METSCRGSPALQGLCRTQEGGTTNPLPPLQAFRLGPGAGYQGTGPWRLSVFPCCSELKMAPWELTRGVGEGVKVWTVEIRALVGPRAGQVSTETCVTSGH